MPTAEARVAFVISGVIRQALEDAGVSALACAGSRSRAIELVERWCDLRVDGKGAALTVNAASKTELLLAGSDPRADLYPLGDLYASELAAFGVDAFDDELMEIARQAGGMEKLDGALRKLLDERRPADAAFAGLSHMRDAVMTRLQKTRFRRAHMGLVPKLGARTIGIDLHI